MSITRVLSALALIAVVGGIVWGLPPVATVSLAAVVAAIGGVELARLARPLGVMVSDTFVAFSAAAFCILLAGRFPTDPIQSETIVALMIGLMVAAGLVTLATVPPGAAVFVSAAVMLLAPLYIGLPLGALAWIRDVRGPEAVTWLVAVIAVSDTAQYVVGSNWGRRKLSPVVSPGKTIEGALGGFATAPIVGAALGAWALPDLPIGISGLLAFGLALIGLAGDLFESLLKRSVGAKDSSALIPGHGGVLDRIDAYLFAAPAYYLFLRYIA